ncbi:PaaI family thioesterase [Draconibacterium halophilum]|uniref:PaaI family thioesterase n=1 Tax=Draconibacterium halophilum TaxID=2706887 RepID=A0A6C0RC39_9BACT|nr:PaaI family thioesterase [Draconibacterium halophilum]QIA07586.1 PaaI family thioesterase [Draconibacterium halophilum]
MDFTQLSLHTPVELINQALEDSLVGSLGIEITKIEDGRVEGMLDLSSRNSRPGGILHGGANLALGETLAGLGSMLLVDLTALDVLGIMVNGNHTGILKAGKAVAVAKIVHRGKQTHVWNVDICNEEGRLISSVRVTNMITEKNDR